MPIREACHVAIQKNHPSKNRLWKHAQARQEAKGQGSPVLQIVSTTIIFGFPLWAVQSIETIIPSYLGCDNLHSMILILSFWSHRFKWTVHYIVERKRNETPKSILKFPLLILSYLLFQVSYGSELSNRGPTFDMDLSDFMDGEKPISYDKAKKYFAQDPSHKYESFLVWCVNFVSIPWCHTRVLHVARWAAYVAGAILVLMTELGERFPDSISILVCVSTAFKLILIFYILATWVLSSC